MATNTEATATPAKPVRYISRYLQLRIVRKPGYSKEIDGQRVSTPGTSIQFDQGTFETSDPAEIEFIESRPEYGKIIQRVPDNIENIAAQRDEVFQDLEAREAALKAREDEVAAKEAALKNVEMGKTDEEEGDEEDDGLDAMTKKQLLEVATAEGVEGVSKDTKNEDIVAAIRAKRADQAAFTD